MLVNQADGCCRECKGEVRIISADETLMTVECLVCNETYDVEHDAFNDGGTLYLPEFMADQDENSGVHQSE